MKTFLPYIENIQNLNTNLQVEQGYLYSQDVFGKITTDTDVSSKKFVIIQRM